MSSEVSFGLLLRLAALLATFLAQSSEGDTYQDFKDRHIAGPPPGTTDLSTHCNRLMRRRGMTRGTCKPHNTFLIHPKSTFRRLCRQGGTRQNGVVFESESHLRLLDCHSTGQHPNCNYVGKRQNRRIRVGCDDGLPVHFYGIYVPST